MAPADDVIVLSQFSRRCDWDAIGPASQVLPLVVDWERVRVDRCAAIGNNWLRSRFCLP